MKVCSLLFLTCLIASVPIIDTGQLVGRVKRIVTQVGHQRGRAKAFGAPVEAAEDLRRHLIKLYLLLRQEGGFSNSHRAWTQHDIALATHFVSIFYSLNENGFKLPNHPGPMSSEETNKILVDFMAACFSLFHEETGLIQLPPRDPSNKHFEPREADDFLREVTATFFILFNGGNVLTLQNSSTLPDVDGELARRLRANYAALLSRAGGLKLPFKGCGENQDQVDRDWPWMAVLLSNRFKWRLFCGAVLVNEWFVLTAAHCLEDKTPDDVTVRLGEYHFREENSSRVDHRVEAIYIHEGFNGTTFDNDIALMQLKEKADLYNSKIWPICLPPNWLDLEDRNAFVAGWGKTSVGGKPSEVLLDAFIPIWKRGECEHLFMSRNDPINYQLQFCAGPKDGGEDACDGDSGGPLMYKMDSGRWAVIGIVSWGIDGQCAVKGEPGVYTRVSAYTEWIYSKMNNV